MKVYRLNWLDPRDKEAPEWEIAEQWEFSSIPEAKAFCRGLNMGFDRGRVDHCYVITEDEFHSYKIRNAFVFDLKPRLEKLCIGFLMDYVNDDFTAFNIPDYRLSLAVSKIESLLQREK